MAVLLSGALRSLSSHPRSARCAGGGTCRVATAMARRQGARGTPAACGTSDRSGVGRDGEIAVAWFLFAPVVILVALQALGGGQRRSFQWIVTGEATLDTREQHIRGQFTVLRLSVASGAT
jgi:hypothetical protein